MFAQKNIVIVAAKRSAIGKFMGGLSSLSAVDLGTQVAQKTLESINLPPSLVDEIICGHVLSAGCGQNSARQVALNIGMTDASVALGVNHVCGSGLRSVILGAQSLLLEQSDIALVGGQESMSNAPHYQQLRNSKIYGDTRLEDSIIVDGLRDAKDAKLMGVTAERLAADYAISRQAQDAFALSSQHKAQIAMEQSFFDQEIVDVTVSRRGKKLVFNQDEHPRHNLSINDINQLKPIFDEQGGVTAANSSGINDGAAYLVLMTAEKATSLSLKPLAKITGVGIAGVSHKVMGLGPVPATYKALKMAGLSMDEIDLIELNEAFAAQSLAVLEELSLSKNDVRVNVSGGAIALGHPIGASGARILVSLLYNMKRLDKKKGLATLCVGGGQGVSVCVERI